MPRRRLVLAPDPREDPAYAKLLRRYAYLVTNRARPHERAVLVLMALKEHRALTRDTGRLAVEVHAWLTERRLRWDSEEGYWHVRDAIDALRPDGPPG